MFLTHIFNYCRRNHKLPLNWLVWQQKEEQYIFLQSFFTGAEKNVFPFPQFFPSLWQRRILSLHKLSAKQQQNPCSGSPPVYQDLSMYHDWLVKIATVNLPISMKGNSKRTSINLLSPLGAQNIDLSATSQTILTKVKLCLRRRLSFSLSTCVCFYSLSYHKMLVITHKASYFIYH